MTAGIRVSARTFSPRELRGLTLIVVSLLALGTVVTVRLWPAPAVAPAVQPDLVSDMDWISYREGWLALFDRGNGTTVLLRTMDAGAHWSRVRSERALETVRFFDARRGLLTSQDAPGQSARQSGVTTTYRTDDGGDHWRRLALPAGAEGVQPTFADASHGWVWDPSPRGLYRTGDGGDHWRLLDAAGLSGLEPAPVAFRFLDATHGWAVPAVGPEAPALFATTDGGETWTPRPLPPPSDGWPPGSRFDIGTPLIAPDGHGQVLITELVPWEFRQVVLAHWAAATADAGATWSPTRRLPATPPETLVRISTGMGDGSASWAWSTDEVLTTSDGGSLWTRLALPPSWSIDRVQVIDAGTAWLAASVADGRGRSRWRLFSTLNAGVAWAESTLPRLR
jgi:photosystem II stability/assembly factor-like uncharacterized protein